MKNTAMTKKEEREEDFADKVWGFLIGSSFAVLKIVLILFLVFLAILGFLWLLSLLFPYLIEIVKNAVKNALGIG
ncbi:hypothetical protein [Candidatus Nitrosotenuis cloacae]|uniref:Uncharacterized protein n=1 Tax=Candidatus Nitrosotenuis cloacae TaxID=1603555 RepID=A0A3G1B7V7_9ARCH|nr:hypothetical protein [Candidatus Nitrosotenuis cloacae]AJZ76195.1 hypothetical protein SU86_007270 [Candidatus Nitrosotenuis cloacae]